MRLFARFCVCLFVCLFVYRFVCLFIGLFVCICNFVHVSCVLWMMSRFVFRVDIMIANY